MCRTFCITGACSRNQQHPAQMRNRLPKSRLRRHSRSFLTPARIAAPPARENSAEHIAPDSRPWTNPWSLSPFPRLEGVFWRMVLYIWLLRQELCSLCLCPIRPKHNKRPMVLFGVRSVLVRHHYPGLFASHPGGRCSVLNAVSDPHPTVSHSSVPVRSLHLMDIEDFVCERTSRSRFLKSLTARRGAEMILPLPKP